MGRQRAGGGLWGLEPPLCTEKINKKWDIFDGKIVKFHKNFKLEHFWGNFPEMRYIFGTILLIFPNSG